MGAKRQDFIDGTYINRVLRDLSITVGEDWEKTFTIVDPDGAAIDITGWTLPFEVRNAAGDLIVTVLDEVYSQVTNKGQGRLYVPKATTIALTPSTSYRYTMFRIDAGGDEKARFYGQFQVTKSQLTP